MMKGLVTLILGLMTGLLSACATPDATYYLVRHAEKTSARPDPGLTETGHARADDLAALLADKDFSYIYSTDYRRTRDTAKPTADFHGLAITIYDPRKLPDFADILRQADGNVLVVGHSNTTPDLAGLLGVEPGPAIEEKTEYDRLYIIDRRGDRFTGEITTYGQTTP